MKKLAVCFLAILTCQSALAAGNLPFVGEKDFNFYRGNGTAQSIIINKTGNVTMRLHGKISITTYRGKYKAVMCDGESCYKIIGSNKIAKTNRKGVILSGQDENCGIPFEPLPAKCITDLD
ncbi:hypothetical protein [Moraxella nasicaprae]|uniref:Uncharacterized protein n=1 Tax=Moraxella nasicaprae TaxID=2904122 RepID=A0ABY6F1T5_9GAMM|nr:hypothetical protein [Moraxella nasicaprae]UXZ04026.1 hypothetical protein LU297_05215 [Moraxella nasicaprae]